MDKRQKKTRNLIINVFIELISDKSIDEISIQEITEKAEIGRSTFYLHFRTKNELLEAMCTNMFEHIFSKEAICSKIDCNFSNEILNLDNSIQSKILHILYHLQENKHLMCGIILHNSWDVFTKSFKQYLLRILRSRIEIQDRNNHIFNEYLLNHICCSLIETVRWWFSQYGHLSAEQVAELLKSVLFK